MRVSRSLTIKQMAMVSAVTLLFVLLFCVILLFHSVQQNRYNTASQLESIARSVRGPLSASILKGDIPEAETILKRIQPAGVVSRADVVLPNQFQALRMSFIPERPVPMMVMRLFELPVQISLPIYSLERPANPQPLAYLVLQADSYRMYKFVMSWFITLVTTCLLMTLILSVALTWCINRLIVHPLRRIARELNALSPQEQMGHQLELPRLHHDDEIGMLVRSYNLNQQRIQRQQDELNSSATRFPVSELPNKAFLMAMLEQTVARQQTTALMVIACETLQDTAGVLKESQREMLLLTLVEKVKSVLAPRMVLTQVSGYDLVVIANGVKEPWHAITLGQQVLTVINERLPIQGIQLRPSASIGIAMFYGDLTAEQLYRRAFSAAFTARRKGKNQIQFFDPDQMEKAELINRYRIQPDTLILEVTESRRIDDPNEAVAILKPLRNAGIRIALDDFGMGYAGLRQLQHMKTLPVDVLKIDKAFVDGLPEDSSMVQAIIQMARSLNLNLIAEGIETEAQRRWLAEAGVGKGQGFLFARAVPSDVFEQRYLSDAGNNAKV